jgi:hypothetical protein
MSKSTFQNWPQSTQNPQNLKGFCELRELGG